VNTLIQTDQTSLGIYYIKKWDKIYLKKKVKVKKRRHFIRDGSKVRSLVKSDFGD